MNVGWAVQQMQEGQKVSRESWSGDFLFLVQGNDYSHVDMQTASGEIVPWAWHKSDLLASDWTLTEESK